MNNKTKVGHNWRNCACWIWRNCYGTASRSGLWSRLRCLWVLRSFPLSAPISPLVRPLCLARVLVLSSLPCSPSSCHPRMSPPASLRFSEIKWHLLALICLCLCVRAYLRVFERVGGGVGGRGGAITYFRGYFILLSLLWGVFIDKALVSPLKHLYDLDSAFGFFSFLFSYSSRQQMYSS